MENLTFLFVGTVAFFILLAICEPYRFIPENPNKKKKMVGATYWGAYTGTSNETAADQHTIELRQKSRREKYTAGSSTYVKGRGVSMSGK